MQAHPTVPFVKLHPDAIIPSYANPGDAGMDLYCTEEIWLDPGQRKLVKCGVACAIPEGWVGYCCSRSGNALKKGVIVLNAPGIIDSGYRGELGALLFNSSDESQIFDRGARVAQLVIAPVSHVTISEVSTLPESVRGAGGFGSTGA